MASADVPGESADGDVEVSRTLTQGKRFRHGKGCPVYEPPPDDGEVAVVRW
jgi:hypothetical protein